MDCNMPVMDGYTACEKIHNLIENNVLRPTFIIACTADVTERNIEKCRALKFDHIIGKPVHCQELQTILSQNLNAY